MVIFNFYFIFGKQHDKNLQLGSKIEMNYMASARDSIVTSASRVSLRRVFAARIPEL